MAIIIITEKQTEVIQLQKQRNVFFNALMTHIDLIIIMLSIKSREQN